MVSWWKSSFREQFSPRIPTFWDDHHLFLIERSINPNVVIYRVGSPAAKIDAYWMDWISNRFQKNNILFYEKIAYGVKQHHNLTPTSATFVVGSLSKISNRVLKVYHHPQLRCWVAEAFINGQPAILQRVFIQTKPGSLLRFPTVDFVRLEGFLVSDISSPTAPSIVTETIRE